MEDRTCGTCRVYEQTELVLPPRVAVLAELVGEALDLCVRARKLDEQCTAASMMSPDGMHCGTPSLWIMDQYDRDLAAWEDRARKALAEGTWSCLSAAAEDTKVVSALITCKGDDYV